MKEFHVVEFIGSSGEIINKMHKQFGAKLEELRVTVRYEVKNELNPLAAKRMVEIQKIISVNRNLDKNDDAIANTISNKMKIPLSQSLQLVRDYPK